MSADRDLGGLEHEGLTSERVRKVSVSLPESLTRNVRERVGKGSFSHYVTNAVRRQLEQDELDDLLAELIAEHGPIPQDALEEAEREWQEIEDEWRNTLS